MHASSTSIIVCSCSKSRSSGYDVHSFEIQVRTKRLKGVNFSDMSDDFVDCI